MVVGFRQRQVAEEAQCSAPLIERGTDLFLGGYGLSAGPREGHVGASRRLIAVGDRGQVGGRYRRRSTLSSALTMKIGFE